MKSRPLVVANNLMFEQGKVLLLRRAEDGLWCTPGGKVEDESVVEAGRRETLEECGLSLLGKPHFLGYSEISRKQQGRPPLLIMHLLWARWQGKAAACEKGFMDCRWFEPKGLPVLHNLTEGTRQGFRLVADDYGLVHSSAVSGFVWANALRGY